MKVGVFTVILQSMPFEQTLDYLAGLGVQTVEIGTGAYTGTAHCNPEPLLANDREAKEFLNAVTSRGLEISCLSVHGNPVHPNRKIAGEHRDAFARCLRLAGQLGVEVVTTFSGCPGGAPGDQQPNWVTCPWPPDFLEILNYQWNQVIIPYWRETTELARRNGVTKIALEMHPGFVVYNPETLLRLRAAAGPEIGANFDPSHLIWQGIDPAAAVRALQGAIWHVHAKDTSVQAWNSRTNGVLDTKPYRDELNRSWIFRTVGYGTSRQSWCDLISALRMVGYDGALSIEHEDSLMTPREGLEKAIRFLQGVVLNEPKGDVTWA
ncbi:MAG: sugar phosphate isomerase/epimerase [Verrucomicrobia bacterium]|nr:sugar phosphate isomerase/epimerase [Verrucomicrobiota bacterium]MBV8378668.1 sugar phosphate isomerase/epimerase [Verrucomicrobiota bacterium]